MLSKEELLKTRYKVIADYPGSPYKIGDIKQCAESEHGDVNYYRQYPSILKNLEWWEERRESDMPEYVKVNVDHMAHYGTPKDKILNIVYCYGAEGELIPFIPELNKMFWFEYSTPSTKEEYEQYLLEKK